MATPNKKLKSVENKAQAEAATPKPRAGKRQAKLKRLAKASTVTFALEPSVRRFVEEQAQFAGMDLGHFMQKLVENHVLATAATDDPLAHRLTAKRAVIETAVTQAQKLDAEGKFDEHFILTVVKKAEQDPAFIANYNVAVGGLPAADKAAQRARVSLNQQLGRLIKKAAGAKSKRTEAGPIARAQVQDALISTYTLLVKPS